MLKLRKLVCIMLSFVIISVCPFSINATKGDSEQTRQQEIHNAKDSAITLLKAGSIFLEMVGQVTSYASAGQIVGNALWPSKANYFLWGGGVVAIVEKAGKIVYAVLVSLGSGNNTEVNNLSPLTNQTTTLDYRTDEERP